MKNPDDPAIDKDRRRILGTSGVILAGSALGGNALWPAFARVSDKAVLRWGFVGTGYIANSMANVLTGAPSAALHAVSSRKMSTAKEFAEQFDIEHAFDSWQEMAESDVIDAVYIATPTSVKEEISLAAASNGKHVLVEKPLASAESVRRMATGCENNNVAFMDGTHFVHHPRTAKVKSGLDELTGPPWSVSSAFQFNLLDRSNIRYDMQLEPMGAIGDAGWYTMRAAVEYLPGAAKPVKVHANVRRDARTGASIGGSGLIVFEDGSSTTWNCGFDSGALIGDLRITGEKGVIHMNDFLFQQPDNSAAYHHSVGSSDAKTVTITSDLPGAALMFEDFAKIASDASAREHWVRATEATQRLLDLSWESALENEAAG